MKARKASHSLLGNLKFKCSLNSVVYLPTERTHYGCKVSIGYYIAVILESKLYGELIACVADI